MANGTIDKYNTKLVAKAFKQKKCIDLFNIYSLVAKITFIGVLIAIVTLHNLQIYQMNVKTVFLNGKLDYHKGFIIPKQIKNV